MIDILTASIGIGLAVSLMFSEMFGLAAGGMVVPGYIALYLNRPVDIALTLAASFVTYLVVHSMSTFIIIYGKRRTVLMIIIGYLVRGAMTQIPFYASESLYQLSTLSPIPAEWEPIGYVIPGLIATIPNTAVAAIDRLCRVALACYRAWSRRPRDARPAAAGELPFPDARLH